MTIRRIEYTSCEDGVEGIRGFQVRAISRQVPEALRAAAVQDSVYEPAPDLPSMPTDDELAAFPVAFGYSPVPPGAVLFQSRYVGRDHTGRWGNYFAQALTLDRAGELADLLPIDLWHSPIWVAASTRAGDLPELPAGPLPVGGAAGLEATEKFLARPGRPETLGAVLAAVRGAAGGNRGRLVIVADDADAAALWISAITRSLPRPLALSLSFTTYTSRPEAHKALLACTTPDVDVPTYGDYRVLNLSARGRPPEPSDGAYDQIVAGIWAQEAPVRLVAAAGACDPPLQPEEWDSFARAGVLFENYAVSVGWSEPELLTALEFAVSRMPGVLVSPWDGVLGAVQETGDLQDFGRWSGVLRAATSRGATVPGPLLRGYLRVAVEAVVSGRAGSAIWLPELDARARRDLAETVLVPAVLGEPGLPLLDWLGRPGQAALREETLRALEDRLAGSLEWAVTGLSGSSAHFLAEQATHHPRLRLYGQIALARTGADDPVAVLIEVPPALLREQEWDELVALLWPEQPPDPGQAAILLDRASPETLRATGLPDQFVERLIEDAVAGGITVADVELADRLAQPQFAEHLGATSRPTVDAVRMLGYFRGRPPRSQEVATAARRSLNLGPHINNSLVEQLYFELSGWLLMLEMEAHQGLLLEFATADGRFFPAFARAADAELADAPPDVAADLITAWRGLSSAGAADSLSQQLFQQVLPGALGHSGRRHLDRIGECLPGPAQVQRNRSLPGDDWQKWWAAWRLRYEKQSLISRLRRTKPGRERR